MGRMTERNQDFNFRLGFSNYRIRHILLGLVVSTQVSAQQQPLFQVTKPNGEQASATFEEVKELILTNYYYDGLTESDLYWSAIDGMLTHISPPETPNLGQLWTDEEYEKILNSLKGVKVTMGFNSSFNANDGSLTVTSLFPGSEAQKSLKVQDRILRIDGKVLTGLSINQVNQLLDGEVGQSSALKVIRDISVFDVVLKRDSLKENNLIVTKIPGRQTALIELKKMAVGIANELRGHLIALQSEQINSLIIDFRNNRGGVLNEGVNVARQFMKQGDIVLRTQARSNGVNNFTSDATNFPDFSIAILVNENTASAAEIVTAALDDHNRAVIIGKKTYGKGVIETTYQLKNDYRVKFITNAMYGPLGRSWQSVGILPDYFVDQSQANYNQAMQLPIDQRISNDLHLSTALKALGKL